MDFRNIHASNLLSEEEEEEEEAEKACDVIRIVT